MEHPVLVAIALLFFWGFMDQVFTNMSNDKKAVIRFLGYVIAIVLAIATLLFILTQYLDVQF